MSNENQDKIDAALNAAKARVAEKSGDPQPKAKRRRLTPEERAQRLADYERQKAERKAAREAKRAAKLAEREANRKPAHMAKVEKAAEKLPTLSDGATQTFSEITGKLSAGEIFSLSEHLNHFVRAERTKSALEMNLNAGDKVRIMSGHPRFIGQEGTVTKAQRIRCYVEVDGYEKPVYLFTSDVEVLEAAAIETVPEDNEEVTAQAV